MNNNTENIYLEKNSKYYIEQTLLNSLSMEELKQIIKPLYEEYKNKKIKLHRLIKETLEKYRDIEELDKYFIEQMVKLENGGDRLEELENTLKTFNSHLFTRLPNKKMYTENCKKIDVNEVSIETVIGMYIKLPSNLRRNICCPLHKDNTASFKIYKDTNSFYCFGCRRGGNAINFISYMEGISTKDAYKKFIEYFSNK